ncbi:MAG: flagellar basal-body rod protein FlgF [Proteobacteria bacterium]|nr:flagellar basal-body rod protein FlgF [Pseudomonadota bacterium]
MSEIYTMTSKMINQSKMLDTVAHNIANVNTTGFKRQDLSFQSVLDNSQKKAEISNSFSTIKSNDIDFSQGGMKVTNVKLDLAINGDGFFAFKRGEGTVYSRNGHFMLNSTGQMINTSGEKVLGIDNQPIDIPLGTKVNITPQGEVKDLNGATFGQVGIFNVDKSTLVDAGGSSFASPAEATLSQNIALISGSLEASNVNAVKESVDLTKVSREYQSAARLIKTFEDLETKAIRELYKAQ